MFCYSIKIKILSVFYEKAKRLTPYLKRFIIAKDLEIIRQLADWRLKTA